MRASGVRRKMVGISAKRLGLSGKVPSRYFLRLCENQNPSTGETLTQRLNTQGGKVARAGQSADILRLHFSRRSRFPSRMLGKDERILESSCARCVCALREFDRSLRRASGAGGAPERPDDRDFVSRCCSRTTRRAPSIRICIRTASSFNATFDPVEGRWKALQNYELLRARKFAENAYYHELARELADLRLPDSQSRTGRL